MAVPKSKRAVLDLDQFVASRRQGRPGGPVLRVGEREIQFPPTPPPAFSAAVAAMQRDPGSEQAADLFMRAIQKLLGDEVLLKLEDAEDIGALILALYDPESSASASSSRSTRKPSKRTSGASTR